MSSVCTHLPRRDAPSFVIYPVKQAFQSIVVSDSSELAETHPYTFVDVIAD
jgi:hypothetical protein